MLVLVVLVLLVLRLLVVLRLVCCLFVARALLGATRLVLRLWPCGRAR